MLCSVTSCPAAWNGSVRVRNPPRTLSRCEPTRGPCRSAPMLESHVSFARPAADTPRLPSDDHVSCDVRMATAELLMPMKASDALNRFGTRAFERAVSDAERWTVPPYRNDAAPSHVLLSSCAPADKASPLYPSVRCS